MAEQNTYYVAPAGAKPGDFRLIDATSRRDARRIAAATLTVRIATAKDGYEARSRGIAIEDGTTPDPDVDGDDEQQPGGQPDLLKGSESAEAGASTQS